MKIVRTLLFMLMVAFFAGSALGQEITMSARVNRDTIVLGETLTLEVSVSGDTASIPNPTIPAMPGLSINSSGRSQNISFVNGKVSSSITFNYVIMPQSIGKHTIQPITLNAGGKVYETSPILIEVSKSQSSSSPQSAQSSPPPPVQKESLSKTDTSKDIFVKASLDKTTVYVGEQATYTFKFYRRIRLVGDAQFAAPELIGFVKEDLPPQKNYYADVDNTRFMVSEIQIALFPTSPGSAVIGPASLTVAVPVNSRDPFSNDDFFGSIFGARGEKKLLKTEQLSLKVLPFPDKGKPDSFNGAIGKFNITSKVDNTNLKVGEPITLSVTISGKGNIKSITEPVFGDIHGFRAYDTVSSLNSEVKDYAITGSKVFQTVLVPEISGTLELPSLSFSFFDPASKTYKTVQPNPISVTVLPGDAKSISSAAISQGTGIKMIGQDIRFIKIGGMHRIKEQKIGRMFWISGLIIFLLVVMTAVGDQYRMKLSHDVGWARSRKAQRTARAKLSRAHHYLKHKQDKEFYAMLSESVTGYIADKLNISAAGLTIREISDLLNTRKLPRYLISDIKKLLEECDFARFTSSTVSGEEKTRLGAQT
ncbi:MAG: BatD family protein, partial [bacterium]